MKKPENFRSILLLSLLALTVSPPAFAQQKLELLRVDLDGLVERIQPNIISMTVGEKKYTLLLAPGASNGMRIARADTGMEIVSKVNLDGTVEPDFLAKGQHVSFTAELDAKHTARNDLSGVNILSGGDNTKPGLTSVNASADPKGGGTFIVLGDVSSHRNGTLTVRSVNEKGAPITVVAKLAANATINVHFDDLGLARPWDQVKVTGYLLPATVAKADNSVLVETVDIKMLTPVTKAKNGTIERGAGKKPEAKDMKVAAADSKPADAKPAAKPADAPAMPAAKPADAKPPEVKAPEVKPAEPAAPLSVPLVDASSPGANSSAPVVPANRKTRLLVHDFFSIDRDAKLDSDAKPGK